MQKRLQEYRLFWREFRQTFHSTGAVLPSGKSLARSLASRVGGNGQAQKILEVGPGTGPVTREIISRLGPEDRLDLVELNERFVGMLHERLEHDPAWNAIASRVRVMKMPVEEVDAAGNYDVIVSGLPLNNFSCKLVEKILKHFHRLAAPQASLSFFEYVAVRKAKALLTKHNERKRLSGIERLLSREFAAWEVDRDCILANVPPAWVHHLQLPGFEQAQENIEVNEPAVTSS